MSFESFVGSGAECSTGNNFSKLVSHLEKDSAASQAFRPVDPIIAGQSSRPGRQAVFNESRFVDEFLSNGPPAAVQLTHLSHHSLPDLERHLERQFSAPAPLHPAGWADEFGRFHGGAGGSGSNAEFEEVFNKHVVARGPPAEWRDEFMQSHGGSLSSIPAESSHPELERAFQEHHNAVLEQEWSKHFEEVSATLTSKGKEPLTIPSGNDVTDWAAQFDKLRAEAGEDGMMDPEFMEKFNSLWSDMVQQDKELGAARDWEQDFNNEWLPSHAESITDPDPVTAPLAPYVFEKENPYLAHPDPLGVGLRMMDGGNLSEAALAFEAACQRDERDEQAWMYLGLCQAENEKEEAAIAALQRCVQENPQNLKALMALAVSYTNESQDIQAYTTLERYIKTQYPSIPVPTSVSPLSAIDLQKHVTSLFLEAARLGRSHAAQPTVSTTSTSDDVKTSDIDADVQVGLGVLFYNSAEFEKAVDCFRCALSVRPGDYVLWNRLGATLANSGNSEEAISAYHQALSIKPTFVRGRYNLGVSCINIGVYEEAVEHLLGALALHVVEPPAAGPGVAGGADFPGGRGGSTENNVSVNLWNTLRRTFVLMDRQDLAEKAYAGADLGQFRGEFEF
ncbi:hypothetical protein BJ742DRAFT_775289 [Cladochytrium replicatum]|nr:hypothetical protein BJ742DRAFT_775289 [Cladochytrium replicatum]